jgi:hypothetical protein
MRVRLRIIDRRMKVWAAVLAGVVTSREIAALLRSQGVPASKSTVENDLRAELARHQAEIAAKGDEARQVELARLDRMHNALWASLGSDDRDLRIGAVKALARVQERRSRLLGLDAPTKIAPTNPAGDQPYQSMDLSKLSDEQLAAVERARALARLNGTEPGDRKREDAPALSR